MHTTLRAWLTMLVLTALAACGGDDDADGNVEPVKFSALYDDVLFVRCADSSCHGGGSGGAGKLDFTSREKAYAALVDQTAQGPECNDSGLQRVEPADPTVSLLFLKLGDKPPCGARMPIGPALSAEDTKKIKDWIAGGALDD
jgi:hypothetical protein